MSIQSAKIAAKTAGSEIAKGIKEVHGPIWAMRLELVKLIISLCSAILVATITFSESLLGHELHISEKQILILSWLFLLISLLAGLACFWAHTQLGSFHARYFNFGRDFQERISSLDPDSQSFEEDSAAILKKIADKSLAPIGKADAAARFFSKLSFVAFAIGIISFFIFGSTQI